GRDDRIRRGRIIQIRVELNLELGPLGSVFLNEVGIRDGFLHVRSEAQAAARCSWRKTENREKFPGVVHVLAQVLFSVRRWIGGNHVEPAGKVLRCPARADDPGTDNRDPANRFLEWHSQISFEGISAKAM